MQTSKASGSWHGALKDGRGTMRPANGQELAFGVDTRFDGKKGPNPEELIGAALCGCYAMALTSALERAGCHPKGVRTTADVHLDRQGTSFAITGIDLSAEALVTGIEAARFDQVAQETKRNCPVGKALAATPITLHAKLATT